MSANEAQFGFSPSAALGTFALIRLEIVRGYVIVPFGLLLHVAL
jgi:hypothetical protein